MLKPQNSNNRQPASKITRRRFLKRVSLIAGGAAAGYFVGPVTVSPFGTPAYRSMENYAATTAADFLKFEEGIRNPVWINYSSPRSVRGMAANGRYIWAAGYGMVGRIDATDSTYQVYDANLVPGFPGLSGIRRPIAADRRGNLWVGTFQDGAYYFDTVNWTKFVPKFRSTGLNGGRDVILDFISIIKVDPDGDIWFGGQEGIIKLDKSFDPVKHTTQEQIEGLAKLRIDRIQMDNNAGGFPRVLSGMVADIVPGANPNFIWLGLSGEDIRRVHINNVNGKWEPNGQIDEWVNRNALGNVPGGFMTDMVKDPAGKIWGCTVYGAVRVEGDPRSVSKPSLVFYNPFNSDPGATNKLRRFRVADLPLPVEGQARESLWPGCVSTVVADDQENLWFLSYYPASDEYGGKLARVPRAALFKPEGLSREDLTYYLPTDNPPLPNYPYPQEGVGDKRGPGFHCGVLDALHEPGQGRDLWLGSRAGVSRFVGSGEGTPRFDKLIELFNSREYSDTVYDVAVSSETDSRSGQKVKWFATDRGLFSYNGRNWELAPNTDGLKLSVVHYHTQTKTLWFGGEQGIQKRDNQGNVSKPVGVAKIRSVAVDKTGVVWAGSEKGVYRQTGTTFEPAKLKELTDPELLIPAIAPAPVGQFYIWFATYKEATKTAPGSAAIYGYDGTTLHKKEIPASDSWLINALTVDSNGLVWVGTELATFGGQGYAGKLYTYDPVSKNFVSNGYTGGASGVRSVKADDKGRIWVGSQDSGVYLLTDAKSPVGNWGNFTSESGLVYNLVTGIAFETNPYTNKPDQEENLVWISTLHGISQLAVATKGTNFEPNDDRFIGFPLKLSESGEKGTVTARFDGLSDVDWFKVAVKDPYSRITVELYTSENSPYDLDIVLYPPSRKSNSNSAIFGGLGGIGNNMSCPEGDPDYDNDNPGFDSNFIKDRNSIIAFSNNRGNQPEIIEALLSTPVVDGEDLQEIEREKRSKGRNYYQIGVAAHNYKDVKDLKEASYTLIVKVLPPSTVRPPRPDFSSRHFYRDFDRLPPPDERKKALVVTHSARFAKYHNGKLIMPVLQGLKTFQGLGPEAFEIIDLADAGKYPEVNEMYDAWDKQQNDPLAANHVCEAIRSLIVETAAAWSNLQYVVIAGADKIVPFYRAGEEVRIGREHNFSKNPNLPGDANDAIKNAFELNFHLTDNLYGALRDIPWNKKTIYVPELAVGRLVETVDEIEAQIKSYISRSNGISVKNALLTGYDFLQDLAEQLRDFLNNFEINLDTTLINNSWGADLLRDRLFNNAQSHQLIVLNAHFDQNRALTANYDDKKAVLEKKLFNASELIDNPNFQLAGTVIFSVGCHSGLNIPPSPTSQDNTLDFAQAIARRGGILVGNTGYSYGDSEEALFSELLNKLVIKELETTPEVGKALMKARQQYLIECGRYGFGEYDVKVLNIATVFGMPMQRFELGPKKTTALATATKVNKLNAASNLTWQPGTNGLHKADLTLDFTGKFEPRQRLRGSYYVLKGLGEKVQALPGRPILPKYNEDITVEPGFIAHGVLLLKAKYDDLYDFLPLITNPTADIDLDSGVKDALNRDFFSSDSWTPATLASIVRQNIISANGPGAANRGVRLGWEVQPRYNLTVVPMQVRNGGRARLYNRLECQLYASKRNQSQGPVVTQVEAIKGATGVDFKVRVQPRSATFPLPTIERVLVTYTFLDGTEKEWLSFDLSLDKDDPLGERWKGFKDGFANRRGVFFIQALDSDGNVTYASNKSLFDTWVPLSQIDPPRTIKARLLPVECAPGQTVPDKVKLFLQAVGDELAMGINRIKYSITYNNGKPAIEGSIRNNWGIIEFDPVGVQDIRYWAEDLLFRLEGGPNSPGRIIFIVDSLQDSGTGSLRQALTDLKNMGKAGEGSLIIFRLQPSNGQPATIKVLQELPIITTDGLTIDGLALDCSNLPEVLLNGGGFVQNGLEIHASNVTIRGLRFRAFNDFAIYFNGTNAAPSRGLVEKNYIDNTVSPGVGKAGVMLYKNCTYTIIRDNTIKGCTRAGIHLNEGEVKYNSIVSNLIGPNGDGRDNKGQTSGIIIDKGASYNNVGGSTFAEGNLLTGNSNSGILVDEINTTGNRITKNSFDQVASNVLTTNKGVGLRVRGRTTFNLIEGNQFIGNANGIHFEEEASDNLVISNYFENNGTLEIQIGRTNSESSVHNRLVNNTFVKARQPVLLGQGNSQPYMANEGIEPPVVIGATKIGQVVRISGSSPLKTRLEVFVAVNSGSGQADYIYAGSFEATTSGSFTGIVLAKLNPGPTSLELKPGDKITLLATDEKGNTSQFSNQVTIQ